MNRQLASSFGRIVPLAAACAVFSCAAPSTASNEGAEETPPAAAVKPAAPAKPEAPKLRLPDTAQPVHIALDLRVVPTEDRFRGTAKLEIELKQALDVLWLNATDLTIHKALLGIGGEAIPPTTIVAPPDFVGFQLPKRVGPGRATLLIEYEGAFSTKENDSLFKLREGDEWYVYTHFEPIDARRAFPCFDEPQFKHPWQVTLHVKKEHLALSNTPAQSESDEPEGMKVVRFAETKPMPSYLMAMGVGSFEAVDAGLYGKNKTPIRIITPKGKGGEAKWAVESTGPLLELLEAYFGTPYPYEKIDHISIPINTGAMENPGLITFGHQLLLNKPERDTIERQRAYASVATHELAHQWFGDLVTMSWWDDLWLNEGFATWITPKIVDQWKPAWDFPVQRVFGRSGALSLDGLSSARKIRQPIESNDDILNAFDGITYGKAAAVINMFEALVGPEKFRKGIQNYLAQRAWKNATASDFFAAISAEAGFDVETPFRTFVDQPGAPIVSAKLTCTQGQKPVISLAQRRYLPLGSSLAAGDSSIWSIPVCVRYGAKKDAARQCTLLTAATGTLPLDSTTCPEWMLVNEGSTGYYRTQYEDEVLDKLLRSKTAALTIAERVGVLGDVSALVRNGVFPADEALRLVRGLAGDPSRHIVSSAVGIVYSFNDDILPEDVRPAFENFVRENFGRRARALGFVSKKNEDENTRLLRPTVVRLVAMEGNDPVLQAKARELALKWLDDRRAVDPDLVDTVLAIASMRGDRALFDRFQAAALKEPDRRDRNRMLSTLGGFRDAKISGAALEIVLSPNFDARDAMQIFWNVTGDHRTRALAYDFLKANYDPMIARLPRDFGAYLPFAANGFCDAARAKDAEAFFKDRAAQALGGPRNLAQSLERIELCRAFRDKQQGPAISFFRGVPKS